jgi:hypothetical protein
VPPNVIVKERDEPTNHRHNDDNRGKPDDTADRATFRCFVFLHLLNSKSTQSPKSLIHFGSATKPKPSFCHFIILSVSAPLESATAPLASGFFAATLFGPAHFPHHPA